MNRKTTISRLSLPGQPGMPPSAQHWASGKQNKWNMLIILADRERTERLLLQIMPPDVTIRQ